MHSPKDLSLRTVVFALIALLALAGLLRFWGVWDRPLWDDEISTLHYSEQGLRQIYQIHGGRDSSPLGLYFFYHYYGRLGVGHVISRLPMLVSSILAVLFTYLLARSFGSRRMALIAAAALTISPLATACSQDLRMQSLVLLCATAGSLSLVKLLQGRNLGWSVLLAICWAALINLHYATAFLFAAWVVMIVVFSLRLFRAQGAVNQPQSLERWAVSLRSRYLTLLALLFAMGFAAASFVPTLKIFFVQAMRGQTWRPPIGLFELLIKLAIYFSYGAVDDHFPTLIGPLDRFTNQQMLAGIILMAAMSIPFAALCLRGARGKFQDRWMLLILAALPPLMLIVITRAVNLFDVRPTLYMLPALLILLAIGLERTWNSRPTLAVIAASWLLLTSGLSLRDYYYNPDFVGQDFRLAARQIEDGLRPGDAVVSFHPQKTFGLEYYLQINQPLIYLFDDAMINQPPEEMQSRISEKLDQLVADHNRIWLFDYHGKVYDFLGYTNEQLRQRMYQVGRWSWGREPKGFSLELYSSDVYQAASSYVEQIDLRPGGRGEGQILSGLYPQSPEGRWMAQRALFVLPNPQTAGKACADYHLAAYLGEEPLEVSLVIDGATLAARSDRAPGDFDLCGPFQPSSRPLLYLELIADRTFIPGQVDPRLKADTSSKSIFVYGVGIESQ
ncbi:MAG: glycosyltransferase family 39 protein [Candidatus Alcyoniella australis]|nr:glycosyltransferase family 39 protein [Candidatus Alcyoniella australis]